MANSSLFHQIKHLGTPKRIGIILLGLILFALIFFLEYTHSTKHDDLLGSIIYAIPFPGFLTASLLILTMNSTRIRQAHVPWYSQYYVLLGLLYFTMALIFSVTLLNSLMDNNLPDIVALPIAGVAFLLMLWVCVRMVMLRRSKTGIK